MALSTDRFSSSFRSFIPGGSGVRALRSFQRVSSSIRTRSVQPRRCTCNELPPQSQTATTPLLHRRGALYDDAQENHRGTMDWAIRHACTSPYLDVAWIGGADELHPAISEGCRLPLRADHHRRDRGQSAE